MELTKQDIQKIDNYLKRGIDFWDIRLEIIDHFASKLEDGDDVVLNNEFFKKEFGTPWELSRIRYLRVQISKKCRKQVVTEFITFFKSIKNLSLIIIFLSINFSLLQFFKLKSVFFINLVPFIIFYIFIFYYSYKKTIKSEKGKNKSFTQSRLNFSMLSPLFIMSLLNLIQEFITQKTFIEIYILYLLFSVIWTSSAYKVFSKIIKKHKEVFNQYKFLNI